MAKTDKANTDKTCNWLRSQVSTLVLDDLIGQGLLPAQGVISWPVAVEESSPQPDQGEVVVFIDHLHRGFSPPELKSFREFLNFFDLHS